MTLILNPTTRGRDSQPGWLRKSRSFQKRRRALELVAESCRHAVAVTREFSETLKDQGLAYGDPLLAMGVLRERCAAAEVAVQDLETLRKGFLTEQTKAEVGADLDDHAESGDWGRKFRPKTRLRRGSCRSLFPRLKPSTHGNSRVLVLLTQAPWYVGHWNEVAPSA